MKIVKYPRTRHIEGSRLQHGDMADDKPLKELAGQVLTVEEKLDGANSALSFAHDGSLLLQSRGYFLTGSGRACAGSVQICAGGFSPGHSRCR